MEAQTQISKKNNETTNNWLFTLNILEKIMNYDLAQKDIWAAANTEIAKMQFILNAYKTAFNIENDRDLYRHLKEKKNYEDNISYDVLQQDIVDTYLILEGRLELWHKRPTRQYMRDRFFFEMNVLLSNVIVHKHLPKTSGRNLKNKTNEIIKVIKSVDAKGKADKRWNAYREDEQKVFELFKEDYEYEGDSFFAETSTYYDKIRLISRKYEITENGKRKKVGIAKARKWHSAVCVKKRKT